MRFLLSPAIVAFALSTIACSSPETPSPGDDTGAPTTGGAGQPSGPAAGDGATPGCKLTLSGAQSGEYGCTVSAGFDTVESYSVVSILKAGDPSPYGGFFIKVPGKAVAGPVSYASAAEGGFQWKHDFAAVYPEVTPTWFATKDPQDPSFSRGDFSMNLTSVAEKGPTHEGIVHEVHGTMTGTLPFMDGTGAAGIVNVSITF